MKRLIAFGASALLAATACAVTATKEYVDRKDNEKETAAKAYADAATNEVASALRGEIAAAKPADYDAVKAKAESALQPAATNGLLRAESDPTVPAWAKAAAKPAYTAGEVGAYAKAEIDAKGYVTKAVTNGLASAASLAAKQERPAAPVAASVLSYRADGSALSVSVAASASLAAELAGWTEGQAQTALVTLAAGASVDSGVRLVGYGSWPTNRFLASCVRVGTLVYVTPVTLIAE